MSMRQGAGKGILPNLQKPLSYLFSENGGGGSGGEVWGGGTKKEEGDGGIGGENEHRLWGTHPEKDSNPNLVAKPDLGLLISPSLASEFQPQMGVKSQQLLALSVEEEPLELLHTQNFFIISRLDACEFPDPAQYSRMSPHIK